MSVTHQHVNTRHTIRVGLLVVLLLSVMACVLLGPGTAQAAATKFKDVPTTHPHHIQIETLGLLGIIEGYSDNTFRPNEPVTRQQFAKMVMLAMRYTVDDTDECVFRDMAKSSNGALSPYHYVAAAVREGIITGYVSPSGSEFKPGANITLAQVVTMSTRAAGRPLTKPPASYKSAWAAFDPAHTENARIAQYNGLLQELAVPGKDLKSLSPWANATRAQAAALLFNVMGTDPEGLNGRFLGDASDLVSYFVKHERNPQLSVSIEELARLYVKYGRIFGIRADMAWAQMAHETGYCRYGNLVQPEQNNFAGIGATGEGYPGNFFATAELGVIAQYAHLAWYVYPTHIANGYCVSLSVPDPNVPITTPGDPRHFKQADGSPHKGNVRTVYDLSAKWAVSVGYGANIQAKAAAIVLSCGLW
jgi:hypothetical protein